MSQSGDSDTKNKNSSVASDVAAIRAAAISEIERASQQNQPEKQPDSDNSSLSDSLSGPKSLRKSNKSSFHKATMGSQTMSQKELKKAFDSFDTDRSGTIDKHELKAVLHSVGKKVSDKQLNELMEEIDLDKNGVLDFSEFEYIVQVKLEGNLHDEQSLRELFEFFDRDKDGFISFEELYWVMNKKLKIKISREEVQDMVRYGDLSGSNVISFDEFCILMSGGA